MKRIALALAFALALGGCSTPRPPGGGLTESEMIVLTAAIRSAADIGCDRLKEAEDAQVVVGVLELVGDSLGEGDFASAINLLQERANLSLGEARAALNALILLRALIPTEALESQYLSIFQAGVDECTLLLETKFPEIAPGFGGRVMRAMGL